jgi:hypothetical protein
MIKTVISDPLTYDVNNMIFEKPKEQSSKAQNGSTVTFHRVNIKTRNPDGKSVGDLILKFDRSVCLQLSDKFGIEQLSALLLLWDSQAGPTPRQRKTEEVLNGIIEKCREWFSDLENRKLVKKPGIKPAELFKSGLARRKEDENGNINPDDAPMMAIRLIQTKDRTDKNGNFVPAKVLTSFYSEDKRDANGNQLELSYKDLIGKRFYATFAVKVEDIFIGKDISIQCKLVEAVVKLLDDGPKRLLADVFSADDDEEDSNDYSSTTDISSDASTFVEEETNTTEEKEMLQASEDEEERPPTPPVKGKGKRGGKN